MYVCAFFFAWKILNNKNAKQEAKASAKQKQMETTSKIEREMH